MVIFKLKIFDSLLKEYSQVEGIDTWFTYADVAKAFTHLMAIDSNNRFEVHEIVLAKVCRLED